MMRQLTAGVIAAGLLAGGVLLAQDGSTTLKDDAVQASPEQIAAEMREVATRKKVPLLVVQMADALGTWRGVGARDTVVAVNFFEIAGNGAVYQPAGSNRKD